jgi:hypothetical protein
MKRCAWIKSDKDGGGNCPFGLPITEGCQFAGDSVSHMCPLKTISKDKQESVEKANKRVYIYYKTNTRCMYAANVIEEQKVVNCDFGDTAAGMSMPAFSGSPLYSQTFAGVGLDGLYAFPLGFYSDNNESRNLFQGLFSLVGSEIGMEIIRTADDSTKSILDKLSNNESLKEDEKYDLLQVIEKCRKIYEKHDLLQAVEKCRENYEENNTSNEKLNQMINKWNPRKRL